METYGIISTAEPRIDDKPLKRSTAQPKGLSSSTVEICSAVIGPKIKRIQGTPVKKMAALADESILT